MNGHRFSCTPTSSNTGHPLHGKTSHSSMSLLGETPARAQVLRAAHPVSMCLLGETRALRHFCPIVLSGHSYCDGHWSEAVRMAYQCFTAVAGASSSAGQCLLTAASFHVY